MVVSIGTDYHFLFDLDLTPSCILRVNLTKEVSKMADLTITQVAAKYNLNYLRLKSQESRHAITLRVH